MGYFVVLEPPPTQPGYSRARKIEMILSERNDRFFIVKEGKPENKSRVDQVRRDAERFPVTRSKKKPPLVVGYTDKDEPVWRRWNPNQRQIDLARGLVNGVKAAITSGQNFAVAKEAR